MSNTNGLESFSQSMNGLIVIYADDITTNTLTTNNFKTQNIEAPLPISDSNIYTLTTAGLYFGTNCSFMNFGGVSCSNFNLSLDDASTLTIGAGRVTGTTTIYGGTDTTIYAGDSYNLNLNASSTLTLGTGKTSGQTTIYGGTDTDIYTNNSFNLIGDTTGRSNVRTILGINEVYQRFFTSTNPAQMTCEVFVDIGGTYRVSTAYYQYYLDNNQFVVDLANLIPDTIQLRFGCSQTYPGVENARFLIQNGTANNYEGDVTIESKTFSLLTQTTVTIGTAIGATNNIGTATGSTNNIGTSATTNNIGTSSTTNNIGTSATTNNIGTLTTTNNNIGGLRILNNTISAPSLTTINIGDYIVPSYSYPITASIGAIGNTYAGSTFTTGTMSTGTSYTVSSISNLPAGVYMASVNMPVNCTATGALTKINIVMQTSGGTIFINSAFQSNGNFTVGTFNYPVTTVVSISATSTIQLLVVLTFSTGTFTRVTTNALFTAVRIA
jgi:hypothetical protein